MILVTRNGLSLRFHEEQARSQGRATSGVYGIRPTENDCVIGLALVSDDRKLLVASENGIGKRTSFDNYRLQSRGGKGVITMKCTDKTGKVVGAAAARLSRYEGMEAHARTGDVRLKKYGYSK